MTKMDTLLVARKILFIDIKVSFTKGHLISIFKIHLPCFEIDDETFD